MAFKTASVRFCRFDNIAYRAYRFLRIIDSSALEADIVGTLPVSIGLHISLVSNLFSEVTLVSLYSPATMGSESKFVVLTSVWFSLNLASLF